MQKSYVVAAALLLVVSGAAVAQTANKGLATPQSGGQTTGEAKSGSGSSTSGGKDANGNQGRDAMPESNINVKPLDQQGRNDNGSPKR